MQRLRSLLGRSLVACLLATGCPSQVQIEQGTATNGAGGTSSLLAGSSVGGGDSPDSATASGPTGGPGAGGGTLGTALWAHSFGDEAVQIARGFALDSAGNVAVTGEFVSTIDFGTGLLEASGIDDMFIAVFGPDGNALWSVARSYAYNDSGLAVAFAPSGGVVVAGMAGPVNASRVLIGRYDSLGNELWTKMFGEPLGHAATGVALDASGNVIVIGTFVDSIDFGGGALVSAGSYDAFVAALDEKGDSIWSRRFGSEGYDGGVAVAMTEEGPVVVGRIDAPADFGAGMLAVDSGFPSTFLVKLASTGDPIWSRAFVGPGWNTPSAVTTSPDPSHSIVVSGRGGADVDFGGGPVPDAKWEDGFVVKLDPFGQYLWSRRVAADGFRRLTAATDPTGNVFFAGSLSGPIDFGDGQIDIGENQGAFLAKFDAAGAHLTHRLYPSAGGASVAGVAVDPSGSLVLAGSLSDTLEIGGELLTSGNGDYYDVFVAKVAP